MEQSPTELEIAHFKRMQMHKDLYAHICTTNIFIKKANI